MEILKDISILWTLAHTLVMFLLLFESRFSRKKTAIVTLATMLPLMAVNFLLFIFIGSDRLGTLMLATLSLPSIIVFWILSKHRDGRFFFTFCMVDTIALEILYATNIINYYLTPTTNLFLFIVRMAAFPVIEFFVYKKLRPMFLDVQRRFKRGWGIFALIGASFYLAITLLMSYPTPITERPENIPVLVLLFVLMPVIYVHIILTLRYHQRAHERIERDSILQLQVASLTSRMEELADADERFRVERHNFRHKLKTLAGLIKKEQYDECLRLLSEYDEPLDKTKVSRYCRHSILDATLSSYIQRAKDRSIRLELGFAFPDVIPVNEAELATAIANALENAINACETLDEKERFIEMKVLDRPRFMLRIANSYSGEVEFDGDGVPVNEHEEHGFGTRFIAAFCNKNGGFYQFSADGEKFTLTINF